MKLAWRKVVLLGAILLPMSWPLAVSASQMNLGHVFSAGAVPPNNPTGPWLDYSVQSLGANTILFTLSATPSMTNPEKIKEFYFNFDDTLTAADLSFSLPGMVGSFTAPTISKNSNGLKADGDGWYDLRLGFDTSGGAGSYFNAGDSLSYTLTYAGSGVMTETSFEFLSQPGGGEGTYYAAAHIQSTPAGGSGSAWLGATTVTAPAVPEPTTAALIMAAFLVFKVRNRPA